MREVKNITIDDFTRLFECCPADCPEQVLLGFEKINTRYYNVTVEEVKEYILHVLRLIDSPDIVRKGEENYAAWEKGWKEQLDLLNGDYISHQHLKPKYFRPSKFLRYNRNIIVTENHDLEYDLFTLARHLIFSHYLSQYDTIYEFGCGSCHNLLMLSELFPTKQLHGFDWSQASIKIAQLLRKQGNRNIESRVFDMTHPPSDMKIKPRSAFITIHSLEQLGTNHEELISFILRAKPDIVVNYEPILELYDKSDVLDYLAFIYSRKRNYLSGFLTALHKLEEQNKVEIIHVRRPALGGILHEASLVVWKPL